MVVHQKYAVAARWGRRCRLRAHPAMEAARTDLRYWVEAARGELSALPDVPARAAFEALCDYVLDRTG